jgi:fatty acid desaturase
VSTWERFTGKGTGGTAPARLRPNGTALGIALAVWACVMVPVMAVVLPLAGWGVLAPIAVGLLVGLLFVCTLLCRPLRQAEERWANAVNEAASRSGVEDRLVVGAAKVVGGPRRRGARLRFRERR